MAAARGPRPSTLTRAQPNQALQPIAVSSRIFEPASHYDGRLDLGEHKRSVVE